MNILAALMTSLDQDLDSCTNNLAGLCWGPLPKLRIVVRDRKPKAENSVEIEATLA